MTLKDLTQALLQKQKALHPTMPEHALVKKSFSDKTANGLTKAILAYYDLKGIQAHRQRSEGRYIPEKSVTNAIGRNVVIQKGKFIPLGRSGGVGAGDIVVTLPPLGRSLHIEIKIGKDRQRDSQKEFQKRHEASGGIYWIVKTWDDFIKQSSQYFINNKAIV